MKKKIYISMSTNHLEYMYDLKSELDNFNYDINYNNQIDSNISTENNTIENINQSDIVIAFLYENDPNVIFEIGYALGKNKVILLVTDYHEKLIPNLRLINLIESEYLNYDVKSKIINFIENIHIKKNETKSKMLNNYKDYFLNYYNNINLIDDLNGREFEGIIYRIFQQKYQNILRSSGIDNYGYDFLLHNYKSYYKTLVEVKKYSINNKVSISQLQKFLGALYSNNADCGLFVSYSGFTRTAIDFAEKVKPSIELIDMEKLVSMI
ncbi:MAG: restriction endonuclease [Spirochaetaceae bacterium]